jgi:uncharacterized Tic20 family protein
MDQPPAFPNTGGVPAEITADDKMIAMLAHLSGLVGAIIVVPLVIYLVKKDSSPFVAYHAMQALIFQGASFFVVFTVVSFVMVITCGIGVPIMALGFLPLVGGIMFALKANNGEWAGYPGIAHIGRPPGV